MGHITRMPAPGRSSPSGPDPASAGLRPRALDAECAPGGPGGRSPFGPLCRWPSRRQAMSGSAARGGPDVAESEPGQEPWLTLTEAARRTGRHPDALRAMIRRGKLDGRKGNAGQWLVRMTARMLAESTAESDSAARPDMADVVAELRQEVLEVRVAAARTEAERDSAVAVLAEVRATLAEARELHTAERARADRLEAALAEARRPWLARLLAALRR